MENPHATSLPLLDEVKLQARVGRTSAFGASCSFAARPGEGPLSTHCGNSTSTPPLL